MTTRSSSVRSVLLLCHFTSLVFISYSIPTHGLPHWETGIETGRYLYLTMQALCQALAMAAATKHLGKLIHSRLGSGVTRDYCSMDIVLDKLKLNATITIGRIGFVQ